MLIGLALAGGSFFAAQSLVVQPTATAHAATPDVQASSTIRVIVASRNVKFGEPLTVENLTHQDWPADTIPEGVYNHYEDVLGTDITQPRRATRQISQGEFILSEKISGFGENVSLVQTLASNTRAVSIEVDAVTSVGGFVSPGDRVDVVLAQGRGDTLRAATILQNIRVLGVDQDAVSTSNAAKVGQTITVEVTPEQGQKLALARRAGVISLTLRTQDADVTDAPRQITVADLLGDSEPEAQPTIIQKTPLPSVEKRTVKVRRGNVSEIVEFDF